MYNTNILLDENELYYNSTLEKKWPAALLLVNKVRAGTSRHFEPAMSGGGPSDLYSRFCLLRGSSAWSPFYVFAGESRLPPLPDHICTKAIFHEPSASSPPLILRLFGPIEGPGAPSSLVSSSLAARLLPRG